MGPAASPMSQMVPNTPMAAPRRRAEARSAMSALVTGVTAPTPRPSSGATRTKAIRLSLRKQRKRGSTKQEANDDDWYSPHPIRYASGDRLRRHGYSQLRAEDDRDLGLVEPYLLGVDWQEAEKGAVAEVHDRFDARRDENRRRLKHLSDTLPELRRSRCESLRLARRRAFDIRQQQHHDERQHAERADGEIGHRIAGGEIQDEAAREGPRGCADVVGRREPAEPSATPPFGEASHIGRGNRREDRGGEAVNKAEREQRPGIVDERIEERREREEERAEHHHALFSEHVGKRARG